MRDAVKIDVGNMDRLARFLATFESADPYMLSPAYFAVTGRRGLWLYDVGGGGVVVAVHPNLSRTAIVFPPFGTADHHAANAALASIAVPADWSVVWGRIPNGVGDRERVLDWRFPVRVLGTEQVREAKGERFRDYRKNINRAERLDLRAVPLSVERDGATVISIVSKWARANQCRKYSFGDLISPTTRALFLSRVLPMSGVLLLRDDEAMGFALWEETRDLLANGISGVLSDPVRGGSEFLIKAQVDVLGERGFSELCIGGSETESLDAFKRKLCPVRSVALGSIVEPLFVATSIEQAA